jgi:hypothetical protein
MRGQQASSRSLQARGLRRITMLASVGVPRAFCNLHVGFVPGNGLERPV